VVQDLCQAEEDEILVPNPMVLAGQDNDYFIGIDSRRPCRFGRLAVVETLSAEAIVEADQAGILGGKPDDEPDDERNDDVLYLLDILSDFTPGSLVGCRYSLEDDEISWEIFEVDEDTLTEK